MSIPKKTFALLLLTSLSGFAQTYEILNPSQTTNNIASDHFVVRYNTGKSALTAAQIQTGLNRLEAYWKYFTEDLKYPTPYASATKKYKLDVWIDNTQYARAGGSSDTQPAMWVSDDAFKEETTISHEFVHCLQHASRGLRSDEAGWFWESHAEYMAGLYLKSAMWADTHVNLSHIYYGSTRDRYCNWMFMDYLKDQYGIASVNGLWTAPAAPSGSPGPVGDPFMVLNRTMGWNQARLNDEFGKYAMRNVTWDYSRGDLYRSKLGNYTNRNREKRSSVTQLVPLDSAQRRFHVPRWWAPQRWGYNLVRLYPDAGASSIKVDFQGVVQTKAATTAFPANADNQPSAVPQPNSGWRWGTVAVSADGTPRYSALQSANQGSLEVPVKSDDKSLWMIVLGAPTKHEPIAWDQVYYSIYRYPWMAQFTNAWPEGYHSGANNPPAGVAGSRHANGGGFVASTAKVAATAFVGPYAKVLGTAQVLEQARVEDYAVVQGAAIVKGSAVVTGRARIQDNSVISGAARVSEMAATYDNATISDSAQLSALTMVSGSGKVRGNAKVAGIMNFITTDVSGTAQLIGDLEVYPAVSKGVFYGIVENATSASAGANRTAPVPEVTAAPNFSWSGTVSLTSQGSFTATALSIPKGISQLTVSGIQGYAIDRIEFWMNNTLVCTERVAPYTCKDTVRTAGTIAYQAKVFTTGNTTASWTLSKNVEFPYITNLQPYRTPNELYLNFNLPAGYASSSSLTIQVLSKANASNWNQVVYNGMAGANRIKFGTKFTKRHTGTYNVRLLLNGVEWGAKSITLLH